ncbi:IcmT/TraK family protein [Defluviimonas salinarum]|uniref:IcmT/TraK family protein n=1 Tax=Defluviimonas salinarum TaxID=2992147 RepID=A0ABT3J4G9_9RHOB|nr:IcmT/TraK family protein [Defluviimonas salinarum]MCW3782586.1 IcmT/TraK family protein [Defluviimonas salinarum]
MYFGTPLYWRETHRQPKFLFLDGRLVIVLFLTVMHIRPWTIGLSVVTILVLWLFDRKGVSATSILRFLRASIVGRKRTARGLQAERMPVDFGFETAAHVARARQMIEIRAKQAGQMKAKSKTPKGKMRKV